MKEQIDIFDSRSLPIFTTGGGYHSRYIYQLMPYYPYLLKDILGNKNFIWTDSLLRAIFTSIVNAVYQCHKKGIAHCKIKPGNIVLDYNLVPTLIGFGKCYVDQHELSANGVWGRRRKHIY